MTQPLTRRQRQIFDFIAAFIRSNGYAPSLAEIGEQFKLTSLATVHKHVTNLAEKGYVRRRWGCSRAIEVIEHRNTVLDALEESVKLQSHYGKLLNQYDGGERLLFAGAVEWMARLDDLAAAQAQRTA